MIVSINYYLEFAIPSSSNNSNSSASFTQRMQCRIAFVLLALATVILGDIQTKLRIQKTTARKVSINISDIINEQKKCAK